MQLIHRLAGNATSTVDLHEVGRYNTPEQRPNMRISITPGVTFYEDLMPLVASDGAPIAATGQGTWGQLYAAGRM